VIELSELFGEKVELRETEEYQQSNDARQSCIVVNKEEDTNNNGNEQYLPTEEMKRTNTT
jgi:hypothetical protein